MPKWAEEMLENGLPISNFVLQNQTFAYSADSRGICVQVMHSRILKFCIFFAFCTICIFCKTKHFETLFLFFFFAGCYPASFNHIFFCCGIFGGGKIIFSPAEELTAPGVSKGVFTPPALFFLHCTFRGPLPLLIPWLFCIFDVSATPQPRSSWGRYG